MRFQPRCIQRAEESGASHVISLFVGSTKKEDFDLKKVFQMEKWIFLVDAACSFGVGFNRFPDGVETILLVVFGATLAAHVYVFKSKKFRKER